MSARRQPQVSTIAWAMRVRLKLRHSLREGELGVAGESGPGVDTTGRAALRIGIGHAERRQNDAFPLLHGDRLPLCLVVEADKVEETVDGQVGEVMAERLALG